jgi:hypothetical protein
MGSFGEWASFFGVFGENRGAGARINEAGASRGDRLASIRPSIAREGEKIS